MRSSHTKLQPVDHHIDLSIHDTVSPPRGRLPHASALSSLPADPAVVLDPALAVPGGDARRLDPGRLLRDPGSGAGSTSGCDAGARGPLD